MQTTDARSALDDVRNYYERNTPAFERFGQGGSTGAIHRAVWGDGVSSRDHAFRYPDELILREIQNLLPAGGSAPLHVLDMGCGVGASLIFLGSRAPVEGTGVTLSECQAIRAQNGSGGPGWPIG